MTLSNDDKQRLFASNTFSLFKFVSKSTCLNAADTVAHLQAALPEIAIRTEKTFLSACHKWIRKTQAEKFLAECHEDLWSYLLDVLPLEDNVAAFNAIVDNLQRFEGRTKGEFVLWVQRQVRRRKSYRSDRDSLIETFDIDVRDFIDSVDPDRFKNFEYLYNRSAGVYLIPVPNEENATVVWKVPNLDIAKKFWPLTARRVHGRWVIVKMVAGIALPLHRVWVNAHSSERVCAADGDFTNFGKVLQRTYLKNITGMTAEEKQNIGLGKFESKEWISNLYIASSGIGGRKSVSAQERQDKFERSHEQYPIVTDEDGGQRGTLD